LIALLPISYILLLIIIYSKVFSLRQAFIQSFIILSLQFLCITEILSLIHSLNRESLFYFHLSFLLIYFIILYNSFPFINVDSKNSKYNTFPSLNVVSKNSKINLIFIVIICIILTVTFLTALFSPPNNWDSHTYHMARIMHWIQNESVDFFLTNNHRQNSYPPFSEYILVNIQVLLNNDSLANLLQWFSFFICIISVSLISKEYGQKINFQILSAFLIATIPSSILASSNTKNDLVLGAYVLLFFYFQLRFIKKNSTNNMLFSGLSMGFALLTKGTSYIIIFPIGTIFFVFNLIYNKYNDYFTLFYKNIIIVFIGLLINLPFYIRCYINYGNILAMNVNKDVMNDEFSISTILENIIRNIVMHLGTTIELCNWYLYRAVQIILGSNMNNPKTTFPGLVFRPPRFLIDEDHAGNLLHTLFIIFSIILLIFIIKKITKKQLTSFLILFFSTLLWCLLLKWQKWPSKQLPIYLISIPFLSLSIQYLINFKLKSFYIILIIIFSIGSIPFLFYNQTRPFFSSNKNSIFFENRSKAYFSNKKSLYLEYKNIIDKININSSLNEIGLSIGGDSWEYPFWSLLKTKYNTNFPKIYHLKINNSKEGSHFLNKKNLPIYIILEKYKLDFMPDLNNFYNIEYSGSKYVLFSII